MHAIPDFDFSFHHSPEPPAMVRVASRGDVMWNRPIFKAPPLDLAPFKLDPRTILEELRRCIRSDR